MGTEDAVTLGRWYLDLYIVGLRVAGRIYQLPEPENVEKVPGVVRQQGKWKATGMRVKWEDVDLGEHAKFVDAKRAVEKWYHEE